MGYYIHLFETKAAHDAVYDGENYNEPWVASIDATGDVTYNKKREYEVVDYPQLTILYKPGEFHYDLVNTGNTRLHITRIDTLVEYTDDSPTDRNMRTVNVYLDSEERETYEIHEETKSIKINVYVDDNPEIINNGTTFVVQ